MKFATTRACADPEAVAQRGRSTEAALDKTSAPIIVRRRDGSELHRYNMACRNQPVRIMGVLSAAGFQGFQLALHRMDRVAGEHNSQGSAFFGGTGDQRVASAELESSSVSVSVGANSQSPRGLWSG